MTIKQFLSIFLKSRGVSAVRVTALLFSPHTQYLAVKILVELSVGLAVLSSTPEGSCGWSFALFFLMDSKTCIRFLPQVTRAFDHVN